MKAFLLAAGFGTRLRPLSEKIPKPLWPFFEVPIAVHAMRSLAAAGVDEVVVNLHHLADRLRSGLEPLLPEGISVRWSFEEKILGSGGALVPWKKFLENGPFFLINSDTYRVENLLPMKELHAKNNCLATLLLRRSDSSKAPIEIDESGRIVRFLASRAPGAGTGLPCEFTGVHILEPEVLQNLPSGKFCINADVHAPLVSRGASLYGHVPDGNPYWSDLGTPERYIQAHMDLLAAGKLPEASPGRLFSQDFVLPGGGRIIAPAYIGQGVVVENSASVGPNAVVGSGSRIRKGCVLKNSVVWANCDLPGGAYDGSIIAGEK